MPRPVVLALLAAALGCAPALAPRAAGAPVPPQPPLVSGHEGAAYVEGARAAFLNPAGLGVRWPAEVFASWTRDDEARAPRGGDARLSRWGVGLGGFALYGDRVGDRSQRYGFGLAAGGEPLRWGLATEWRVDPRDHEVVADHRLGLLSRPAPWLALAGVADHLFQPEFRRERLGRTYTLATGLRPLALGYGAPGGWGSRLTLTADLVLADGGRRDQARTRFGAELEVLRGVLLRGAIEDHGGAHLGLTLRTPVSSLGGHDELRRGRHLRQTYALDLHAGEERTVLAGAARRRVAALRIGGELGDEALSGVSLAGSADLTPAKPIHDQLERALDDPLTRGVLLELGGLANMAQIEELRPRVARLRAAGKPVVAWLGVTMGRGDLYLAAACSRVVVAPEALTLGLGLRVERRSYRGLLAGWGLKVDRSSYGRFKSAYRAFSVDSTPPADREAIEHGLDVSQELLLSAVAADRRLPRDRVLGALDGRPWSADELRAFGLVDSVGYREDALALLGALCGLGREPRTVNLARLAGARRDWTLPSPIAVVYASGAIVTGPSGNDLLMGPALGSGTVVPQIERAFRRPGTRVVVLRVESPGGIALAADQIRHALARMKRETGKPLVVSMGSLGASGGYQIASPADRIYANRFTRTGSIGVVSIKPSLEGWYARHGVRQEDFERGPSMGMWSIHRDLTPAQQATADSATLRFYRRFVSQVASDRRLSEAAVDSVAQGRVWMGEDARARGLVDRVGTLEDALADARQRAGVPAGARIRLVEYRRPRGGLLQRLLGEAILDAWRAATRMPEPGVALEWDEGDGPE